MNSFDCWYACVAVRGDTMPMKQTNNFLLHGQWVSRRNLWIRHPMATCTCWGFWRGRVFDNARRWVTQRWKSVDCVVWTAGNNRTALRWLLSWQRMNETQQILIVFIEQLAPPPNVHRGWYPIVPSTCNTGTSNQRPRRGYPLCYMLSGYFLLSRCQTIVIILATGEVLKLLINPNVQHLKRWGMHITVVFFSVIWPRCMQIPHVRRICP